MPPENPCFPIGVHFCKNHGEGIKIEHPGFVWFSTAFHAGPWIGWCVCFDLLAIYFCSNLFLALSLCFMTLCMKFWKEDTHGAVFLIWEQQCEFSNIWQDALDPRESICFSDVDDYMSFELLFSRVCIFPAKDPSLAKSTKTFFCTCMHVISVYTYEFPDVCCHKV